ncbi:unnamed protein product [Polarella glacialis]|uniref:EF-hand domain-containing protein n=2 Tax=Polarella glacialis TaxID=89957 RepID=A0A813KHA7_POLGL|nr:unnamed protein product [Polarella glacialis]
MPLAFINRDAMINEIMAKSRHHFESTRYGTCWVVPQRDDDYKSSSLVNLLNTFVKSVPFLDLRSLHGMQVTATDKRADIMVWLKACACSGHLEIGEYRAQLENLTRDWQQWTDVFVHFDRDQSGTMDRTELISVLNVLAGGKDVPVDELDSIFKGTDTNKDGKITLIEFISFFREGLEDETASDNHKNNNYSKQNSIREELEDETELDDEES